jgi:hypothetical protein
LSALLLTSVSACAMGGDADDPYGTAEGAITDERAGVLVEQDRVIRIRHHFGSVDWNTPETLAAGLTDEEVLGLNTSIESGRYDISTRNLRLVSAVSDSCASEGEPANMCEWGDAIFELNNRYYLRRFSFARWAPRDATVEWNLILDRASAAWMVDRLGTGEKRDGRDDIYFPIAKKFVSDPQLVPAGTRDSIGTVMTPAGQIVTVFGHVFLFRNDGRVWLLDLDRECPAGKKFDGNSCV